MAGTRRRGDKEELDGEIGRVDVEDEEEEEEQGGERERRSRRGRIMSRVLIVSISGWECVLVIGECDDKVENERCQEMSSGRREGERRFVVW